MLTSGGSFQKRNVVNEGRIHAPFSSTVRMTKVPSESLQGWIIELVLDLQLHRVQTG